MTTAKRCRLTARERVARIKAGRDLRLALKNGYPVYTPLGAVTARPTRCQVCGKFSKGFPETYWDGMFFKPSYPGIVAHHFMGYARRYRRVVVFLCYACHGKEHRNRS